MSGRILNTTPISGEYPEIHFGEHYTKRLWIVFEDNDFEKWYGCFPNDSHQGFNDVLIDKSNNSAFVISSGIGYLINIKTKELIYKTAEHPLIESAILTENPDYFIAGTFYSVYVFDTDKFITEVTPDFMVDGIYFKNQQNKKAIGDLATSENQYDFNMDFEFDLETFDLTLNKKVIRKQLGIFESVSIVDKNCVKKTNIFTRLINKLIE
jgi:hypothetical protein